MSPSAGGSRSIADGSVASADLLLPKTPESAMLTRTDGYLRDIGRRASGVRIYNECLPQGEESMRVPVHLMLALALVSGAADALAAAPVWEGVAIIYATSDSDTKKQCGNKGVDVQNTYTVVYQPHLVGNGPDLLTFNTGHSSAQFVLQGDGTDGTFTGVTILRTAEMGNQSGTYSLSISNPLSKCTLHINIDGNLKNFFGDMGCQVTFSASLTQNPPCSSCC
jgi:hypothetical protein